MHLSGCARASRCHLLGFVALAVPGSSTWVKKSGSHHSGSPAQYLKTIDGQVRLGYYKKGMSRHSRKRRGCFPWAREVRQEKTSCFVNFSFLFQSKNCILSYSAAQLAMLGEACRGTGDTGQRPYMPQIRLPGSSRTSSSAPPKRKALSFAVLSAIMRSGRETCEISLENRLFEEEKYVDGKKRVISLELK